MTEQRHREQSRASNEQGSMRAIEALPEQLGFIENAEMATLRERLVAAITNGYQAEISRLSHDYHQLGEEAVSQLRDPDYIKDFLPDEVYFKGQLGLDIMMAIIRRDGGRLDAYVADLDFILTTCLSRGYLNIAQKIEAESANIAGQSTEEESKETA